MTPPSPTRGRLVRKYVVLLVGLFSLVLGTSALLDSYYSYEESKRLLLDGQSKAAAAAAARIEQFVAEVERQVGLVADAQWSERPDQRDLDYLRLLRQVPAITEVGYVDASGREQLRLSRLALDVTGSQEDFSKDPRFLVAKSGKTYFSPVYFREESEPYMSVSRAGTGTDSGVTVAEVNLTLIWEVVSRMAVGQAGRAYVVDAAGNLIAHPNISLVLRKTNLGTLAQVRAARTDGDGLARSEVATVARDPEGREVLTAHARITPLDWSVFVEQPLDEAFQPLYAVLLRSVVLALGALGLSVLASLLLARRIVKPIRALQTGAARIGAGDLSHRITIRTGDELEALGEEFNRTAARLQESYASLEDRVLARTRDLTRALEELRALRDIGQAISSTLDSETVLASITLHAVRLAGADAGAIQEFDSQTGRFQLRASYGMDDSLVAGFRRHPISLGEGAVGRAVVARGPVQVTDTALDQVYEPRLRDLLAGQAFRAVLAIPLLREGDIVGGLVVLRRQPGTFAAEVVERLRAFTTQSTLAIQNARLYEEAQRELAERWRAQEALVSAQRRLRFLLASSPAVIYSCSASPPHEATFVSANVQALTGYGPEDFLADAGFWASRLHPDDAPGVLAGLEALPEADPHAIEYRFLAHDGTYRWIRDERRLVGGQPGVPPEILGDLVDISERKRAEEALREHARQLEAVRAVSAEITRELDLTSLLQLVTRRATEMVGGAAGVIYLWDEAASVLVPTAWHGYGEWIAGLALAAGQGLAGTVAQDRRGMLVNGYPRSPYAHRAFLERWEASAALAEPLLYQERLLGVIGIAHRERERSFTTQDRETLGLLAAQAAIAIDNARLYAEVGRSYRDLQQAQEGLIRSEKLRALGQMAAGIAHDLNNTLASILGQVELLRLLVPGTEVQERLATLETAVIDGAQVVRRLQGFARQQPSAALVPCDLDALVREVVDLTRPRWRDELQRRGVVIEVRTTVAGLPAVLGQPAELREVLTNLIFNAVDAMPDGGALTLAGRSTADAVVLTVSDTGVGMPEDVRQRIFDPFFTTKGVQGTGLGLSVVYGILERHGGHISVASTRGQGTTFTLRFKVAPAATGVRRAAVTSRRAPSRRILVVDDDEAVRQALVALLEASGHTVLEAPGGAAGIAALRRGSVDCVLTDLGMPSVTGWDVARAARSQVPATPVILLTGWGEHTPEEPGRRDLVDRILGKPVRLDDLLDAINELTARVEVSAGGALR